MMREAFRKTEPRGLWGRAKRGEKEKKEKLGPALHKDFHEKRQPVCPDCRWITFIREWSSGAFFCRLFQRAIDPSRKLCVYGYPEVSA